MRIDINIVSIDLSPTLVFVSFSKSVPLGD